MRSFLHLWEDLFQQHIVSLLRRASDNFGRATESSCIGVHALEECVVFDMVDTIIGESFLFDTHAASNRMYTDCLVQRLPVAALVYSIRAPQHRRDWQASVGAELERTIHPTRASGLRRVEKQSEASAAFVILQRRRWRCLSRCCKSFSTSSIYRHFTRISVVRALTVRNAPPCDLGTRFAARSRSTEVARFIAVCLRSLGYVVSGRACYANATAILQARPERLWH
eukprot:IDg16206t1